MLTPINPLCIYDGKLLPLQLNDIVLTTNSTAAATNVSKFPLVLKDGIITELPAGYKIRTVGTSPMFGDRAIFPGYYNDTGTGDTYMQYAEYGSISTLNNSASWNSISPVRSWSSGFTGADSSRAIYAGGRAGTTYYNNIQYITISTVGSYVAFGTLTAQKSAQVGVTDGFRGIFCGGTNSAGSGLLTNESISISTLGNSVNFGSLQYTAVGVGSVYNGQIGILAGASSSLSVATYMQGISLKVNAASTIIGNLTVARTCSTGITDLIHGIFCGGSWGSSSVYNVMDQIDFSNLSDATAFGNLSVALTMMGGTSDTKRGLLAGGSTTGNNSVYSAMSVQRSYLAISTDTTATATSNLLGRKTPNLGFSGN